MRQIYELTPELSKVIDDNLSAMAARSGCSPEEMGERILAIGMAPVNECLTGAINKFLTK